MAHKKWYVVWKGAAPGVYESWAECKRQTEGFEGALYKSFDTKENAVEAYRSDPWKYLRKNTNNKPAFDGNVNTIIKNSLSVDAACSGNPGRMEYRGVYTETGEEIFLIGPFENATNNIGEFLAIVHGLALLKKQNLTIPIYSDSVNAQLWVKNKKCKTKLEPNKANMPVFDLIERAENWLINNTYKNEILKWETKVWGEIPADFGRK
ncbi:ribonuclease H [Bacteroidia bacterium]|nr:ribonuclease H [Bacteroidia bacterium]GHV71644.1 ribonuclease H [Bacteroidia bacterium]